MAEHRKAITIDFRKFYGMSVNKIEDFNEAVILLNGLLEESGSNYFAAKNFWEYPLTRTEMLLWDLIDVTISVNWDKKANGGRKYQPTKRPYGNQKDKITKNIIDYRKAKSVYKFKKTTKTKEEILEHNRKFIEKQKMKK